MDAPVKHRRRSIPHAPRRIHDVSSPPLSGHSATHSQPPAAHTAGGTLPLLALLYTACFWGVVWYPLRLLEGQGLGGLWATLVMFLAASVPALLLAWPQRAALTRHPALLLLLLLASGWMNTAFVLAVLEGNVMRVMLLFYLSPLWSTLLGWLWLGERPSATGWVALVLASAGAVAMLWQPSLGLPWPQGEADWLALSAGLGFSIANVVLRRLQHLPAGPRVLVSVSGVVLVAGGWLLASGAAWPTVAPVAWLGAVALGGLGIFSAAVAVVYGVSRMPVHRSAVILLFELVAAAASSLWLTEESIGRSEWLGGGLIVLGAYLSARASGETAAAQRKER